MHQRWISVHLQMYICLCIEANPGRSGQFQLVRSKSTMPIDIYQGNPLYSRGSRSLIVSFRDEISKFDKYCMYCMYLVDLTASTIPADHFLLQSKIHIHTPHTWTYRARKPQKSGSTIPEITTEFLTLNQDPTGYEWHPTSPRTCQVPIKGWGWGGGGAEVHDPQFCGPNSKFSYPSQHDSECVMQAKSC